MPKPHSRVLQESPPSPGEKRPGQESGKPPSAKQDEPGQAKPPPPAAANKVVVKRRRGLTEEDLAERARAAPSLAPRVKQVIARDDARLQPGVRVSTQASA